METNNKILLSVCIPTYNRINYLIETLNCIVPQIKDKSFIELLINDNASEDGTYEIISDYGKENDYKIDIKCNNENIGYRNNFNDIVNRARGEYVYLLGDDDIVSPNLVEIITPILLNYKYSIVHFNRMVGNEACSFNKLHDNIFQTPIEKLPLPEFVKRVMSSPNFISSLIFKKEVWYNGCAYDKDKYYGYEWLARILFGALNTNCLYYYFPLVIMRNPPRSWAKNGFLYMMLGMSNIFRDLDNEIPGVMNLWNNRIRKTHFYDYHADLVALSRERGLYKQHTDETLAMCVNSTEKKVVRSLLSLPFPKLISFAYPKCLTLYRLITNKMRHVRKTII